MPTYERAPEEVAEMANDILNRFHSHEPLLRAAVKIDFIFAHPSKDNEGFLVGDAIRKNGVKALGLCKIVGLKDRTMGRGDVEILLDALWWEDASDEQRAALLDHELHHAEVKVKNGAIQRDDLHRPLIRLRKHDVEIGWFDIIALRHGTASLERQQAAKLIDDVGQLYWPQLCGKPSGKLLEAAHKEPAENHVRQFVENMKRSLGPGGSMTISTNGGEVVAKIEGEPAKAA